MTPDKSLGHGGKLGVMDAISFKGHISSHANFVATSSLHFSFMSLAHHSWNRWHRKHLVNQRCNWMLANVRGVTSSQDIVYQYFCQTKQSRLRLVLSILFSPKTAIVFFNSVYNLLVRRVPSGPTCSIIYLLFWFLIPRICTIRMKMFKKSSSKLTLSFTTSFLISPLSADLAWCKIFCVS